MKNYVILGAVLALVAGGGVYVYLSRESNATVTRTEPIVAKNIADVTVYSLSEVADHATDSSCWTVISGKVYDVTEAIPTHPGGDAIRGGCGTDGTALFSGVDDHQKTAVESMLSLYYIGKLQK